MWVSLSVRLARYVELVQHFLQMLEGIFVSMLLASVGSWVILSIAHWFDRREALRWKRYREQQNKLRP